MQGDFRRYDLGPKESRRSQLVQVFLGSIEQYLTARQGELGAAQFDKDDALAVDFVASAANLRCCNFEIPCESVFAIKVRRGRTT